MEFIPSTLQIERKHFGEVLNIFSHKPIYGTQELSYDPNTGDFQQQPQPNYPPPSTLTNWQPKDPQILQQPQQSQITPQEIWGLKMIELMECPDCTFKCPKESEKFPSCEHKFKTLQKLDNQGELGFILK